MLQFARRLPSRDHLGEQFHRQPHDVRLAPLNHVDPVDSVLIAERAGLAFPQAAGKILLELLLREHVHPQTRDGDADPRLPLGRRPETQPAEHAMFAAAEDFQHLAGVVFVMRLAEHLAIAFGHRIAGEHESIRSSPRHVGRFLISQPRYQFQRALLVAKAAFRRLMGHADLEPIAGLGQQLAAARRSAGQNEFRQRFAHAKTVVRSGATCWLVQQCSGLGGDCSIFRPTDASCGQIVARKHGPVPFPRRSGNVPFSRPPPSRRPTWSATIAANTLMYAILPPTMKTPPFQVLYEDNHLLAVLKPAGLPTMGTPGDRPTLLSVAKEYVKDRYNKPGNVYLGVVSRLDAPVTGVVLLARTSKAAARLTEQFRARAIEKRYWAWPKEWSSRPPAIWSTGWPKTSDTAACTSSARPCRGPRRPGSRTGGCRRLRAAPCWK